MKILVVDDDHELRALVAFALRNSGLLALEAANGAEALALAANEQPALIVLDLNLGREDGLQLLPRLREHSKAPVLVLSVRASEDDVVKGLDLGADDYLTKPFSPRTLIARVRALLRRSGAESAAEPLVSGAYRLELEPRRLTVGGGPAIRLTPLELRMVQMLVASGGEIVPSERLIAHVWGARGEGRSPAAEAARAQAETEDRGRHGLAASARDRAGGYALRCLVGAAYPPSCNSEPAGAQARSQLSLRSNGPRARLPALQRTLPEETRLASDLFRRKSLDEILAAPEEGHGPTLKRNLSATSLTLLGIGAVIGAGIFSTVGTAAAGGADHPGAGPALMLSFVITAVTCGFAALCYAEFASMVPISGSAYTYSYATLGELVGWIIGWDLIIEYAVGNVAVAISWSGYFQELLRGLGHRLAGLARHRLPHRASQAAAPGGRGARRAAPIRRRSASASQRARRRPWPRRRGSSASRSSSTCRPSSIVMAHHRGPGASASARAPGSTPRWWS